MKRKRTAIDHRHSVIVRDSAGRFTARTAPRRKKAASKDAGPALQNAWEKQQKRGQD